MLSALNWTIRHGAVHEQTQQLRNGPSVSCALVGRTIRFGADYTACAPCCAGSGRRMIRFGADGTAGTAHSTCIVDSEGRMVRFGADGTAHTPCRVGSNMTDDSVRSGVGSGVMGNPTTANRTVHPLEPALNGVRAVLIAIYRTVCPPELARHGARVVLSTPN